MFLRRNCFRCRNVITCLMCRLILNVVILFGAGPDLRVSWVYYPPGSPSCPSTLEKSDRGGFGQSCVPCSTSSWTCAHTTTFRGPESARGRGHRSGPGSYRPLPMAQLQAPEPGQPPRLQAESHVQGYGSQAGRVAGNLFCVPSSHYSVGHHLHHHVHRAGHHRSPYKLPGCDQPPPWWQVSQLRCCCSLWPTCP